MAQNRNYRRQNPYIEPYLPQGGSNLVYTPTYDPMESQRYAELLTKAQERYDVGRGAFSEFKGQIAGLDTYAPDVLQGRVDEFGNEVQSMVDEQYGGDYGLAANDIIEKIAEEKGNKIYKAINFQNKEAERMRQAQAQKRGLGESLYIANDPSKITGDDFIQMVQDGTYMTDLAYQGIEVPNYDALATDLVSKVKADTFGGIQGLDARDRALLAKSFNEGTLDSFIQTYKTSGTKGKLNKKEVLNALEESFYQQAKEPLLAVHGDEGEARKFARGLIENKVPQLSTQTDLRGMATSLNAGGDDEEPKFVGESYGAIGNAIDKSKNKEYSRMLEQIPNLDLSNAAQVKALSSMETIIDLAQKNGVDPQNSQALQEYSKGEINERFGLFNELIFPMLDKNAQDKYSGQRTQLRKGGAGERNRLMIDDLMNNYENLSSEQKIIASMALDFENEYNEAFGIETKRDRKNIKSINNTILEQAKKLGYSEDYVNSNENEVAAEILPALLNSTASEYNTFFLPENMRNSAKSKFKAGAYSHGTITSLDGTPMTLKQLLKDYTSDKDYNKFIQNMNITGIDPQTGEMIGSIFHKGEMKYFKYYDDKDNVKDFKLVRTIDKDLDEKGYSVYSLPNGNQLITENFIEQGASGPFISSRSTIIPADEALSGNQISRENIHKEIVNANDEGLANLTRDFYQERIFKPYMQNNFLAEEAKYN